MKKTISLLAALIACLSATSLMAVTTTYTDSVSFLANVEAGSYYEDFSGVAAGVGGPLSFSDGVFSYDIDTAPTAPGTPPPGGLFNDPGIISTNTAGDAILVTFTGATVTAVGGTFLASDINFVQIPSDVVVTLSDGTTTGFNGMGFSGFTSDSGAISSIEINTNDPAVNAWATIDDLYVGTAAVPEPGSAILFFSSFIGLLAIRRK